MADWLYNSANYGVADGPSLSNPDAMRAFDSLLANYKNLGINTITFTSYVPIHPVTGALQSSFVNSTIVGATVEHLRELTGEAHAKGFKVLWSPGFTLDQPDAPLVNSETAPSINVANFLNAVRDYWNTYAPLAQQDGVEMLVLGNEQTGFALAPYTANWLSIIADVRSMYLGKLTYADITTPDGTGHLNIDNIEFWGALDYISAENWWPIQMDGAPMTVFAAKGWPAMQVPTDIPLDLYNLSQEYGKPIYFQTFGTKSDPTGWDNPAAANALGIVDLEAQYQFYKQFLDVFQNFSWVVGANAAGGDRDWMPDTSVPGWNSDIFWQSGYSFFDKPSGEMLKAYWLNHAIPPSIPSLYVDGTSGDDSLKGSYQDAFISGFAGNDLIFGGGGINTSVYSGHSENYLVRVGSTSMTVQDRSTADGTDTLVNVQKIQFADQTLETSWFTKTAAMSSNQTSEITELYIASFNRAPDALGLYYWGSRLMDGMTLDDIARSFFVQPETVAAYPLTQSVSDFVTKVYDNVLGRAPDSDGFNYWITQLQQGTVSKDSFLLAIINGAKASTGSAADAQFLANKATVGEHFALEQGLSNVNWAKIAMADVNETIASVTAANDLVDAFALTAATSNSSELMVQLVGVIG